MKSRTSNNSLTNIKDKNCSIKRINNLSNRIRNLENDIYKIKNSQNKNKYETSMFESEKNISMFMSDSNIKNNLKGKFSINKAFVKNPYFYKKNKNYIKYRTNNNSFRKEKTRKENFIYKKIKSNKNNIIIQDERKISVNFNPNIHQKENNKRNIKDSINSNYDSYLQNSIKRSYITTNNSYNICENGNQTQFYDTKKLKTYLSRDKINSNFTWGKKEQNENQKNKDIYLDLEFEIRNLKKRKKFLIKQKKEINAKLILIKNKNKKLGNDMIKEQKYENDIIDNLILLNKEYLYNKNQNELDEFENDMANRNKKLAMKDILFNIMDIKFEYENNILYDKFIEGINESLLNIPIININTSDNNISNKINRLLYLKNKLKTFEENYSQKKKENNKYYIYFTSLLTELNLKSFEELKEFIKNIFIKNIQENKRMKEITNALINNDSPSLIDKKQNVKTKYNNYSKLLNKNRNKSHINYNLYKNKTSAIITNNGFRNIKNNSLKFHGLCFNSFINDNNKENLYINKINRNHFRNKEHNNNEFSKYKYFSNDNNNIYLLRGEEEKN